MICSGINEQNPGRAGYTTMVRRYAGRWKDRFWEIDFLRGLCVVLMVFDHFMYCLWDVMPVINGVLGTSLFDGLRPFALEYWNWDLRNNVREVVILLFFLLCGISCTLTRGNFRRFIPLALVAAGLSAVTSVMSELTGSNMTIFFGVIHMIAAGIFFYAMLDNAAAAIADSWGKSRRAQRAKKLVRFLPGLFGAALLIVYLTCFGHFSTTGGFWRFTTDVTLQDILGAGATQEQGNFLSIFLDLKGFNYRSSDYFPMLPYIAFILLGGIVGRLIYHTDAKHAFTRFDGAWNKPLCFLGRHAAFIYVTHMIAIPCLLALFALFTSLF